MFKLKYNVLVIIQIIFGLLNATLLIKVFGVSAESDAYLLSCSILGILQLLLTLPVFQFLPFYNDKKNQSIKKSHDFYNVLLLYSIIYGIIMCGVFIFAISLIIKIFTFNIDAERLHILKNLLAISMFGSTFYTVVEINSQLLNAEMKFSLPYILKTIPNACIVFMQIYLIYMNSNNVYMLAYAQAIAMFLCAFVGTMYICKTLIKYKFTLKTDGIFKFITTSIGMQLSNSFYQLTFPTILNNFLVMLPQGYVSYYYYAKKILDIINNFTIGPSLNILRSKLSKLISKNTLNEIISNIRSYLKLSICIFIVVTIIAYFIQIPILKLISGNKLNSNDLFNIQNLFLCLIPWYISIIFESAYSMFNVLTKNIKVVLLINISFAIIFTLAMFIFTRYIGIYAIAIATFTAQFNSYIWHRYFTKRYINKCKKINSL